MRRLSVEHLRSAVEKVAGFLLGKNAGVGTQFSCGGALGSSSAGRTTAAMPPNIPFFPSFITVVEGVVLPKLLQHPEWIRLDGRATAGNGKQAGRFLQDGDTWVASEDCGFEPLLL